MSGPNGDERQDAEEGTTAAGEAGQPAGEHGEAGVAAEDAALEAARAEAADYRDQYLRTAAELENLRKRMAREVENARKYGTERLADEMLNVKDSLELGLGAAEQDASLEALLEGQRATLKLLETALERFGVTEIDPAGEAFDPEWHEAISMLPSGEAEPGSVLHVVQKGYRIHERLLRPARVVVAREPDEPPAAS